MGTADVVGLDLEVGNRFRRCAFAEDEVAVGLVRAGVLRGGTKPDQARVHGPGVVLDRAFEEEVAASVGRVMVLERPEVEHLVAVAEVDRQQVALAARAGDERFGAHPGVVAAEGDRRGPQRRVAADVGPLEADLPGGRAVLLHRHVPDPGSVTDDDLDDQVTQVRGTVGQRVREAGETVTARAVLEEQRLLDDDAGRHPNVRAADDERVVEHGERVG